MILGAQCSLFPDLGIILKAENEQILIRDYRSISRSSTRADHTPHQSTWSIKKIWKNGEKRVKYRTTLSMEREGPLKACELKKL